MQRISINKRNHHVDSSYYVTNLTFLDSIGQSDKFFKNFSDSTNQILGKHIFIGDSGNRS